MYSPKVLNHCFEPVQVWCWNHAQLASLFNVGVGEMCEGEASNASRWDRKTGVVWGAGPPGLQHTPRCRGRRGKARCCRWGHSLGYWVLIRLGQEGRSRGGEVIIPLKTTTCRDLTQWVTTCNSKDSFSVAANIWRVLVLPSSSVELSELANRFR